MPLYPPVTQIGTTGGTATSNTSQTGGVTTSGSLLPLHVDSIGNLYIDLQDGLGNPLSSTAGSLDVNITGGATSGTVSQGSTTPGQLGNLIQAAVTTAAPSYTNGQTNPLSLTTTGLLRVDGSAVTQPVSGTITSKLQDGNGNVVSSTGGSLNVNITGQTGLTHIDDNSVAAGQTLPLNIPLLYAYNPTVGSGTWLRLQQSNNGLLVDGSGAIQPVSGTITANAGTGTFTVGQATGTNLHTVVDSGTITVTQTVGTSLHAVIDNFPADSDALAQGSTTFGQLGTLQLAAVSTSSPSYTNGQTNPLSLTPAGALRVDGSEAIQPVSQSGTWNINDISGTISLPTGAATSANQIAVTGSASGGIAAISSELVGGVYNTVAPTLTNGQQASLQFDSSGNLKITGSVSAGGVNQGSTTPGQLGNLIQAAVTTAAPSYTNGQTNPLSLTTTGLLRVDGSAVTQPVSGTFWQTTQPVSIAGNVTVVQPIGSSLHVDVDSLPSIPAGSNAIGSVSVSNFPAVQPISASSLPLPTGAATSIAQASATSGQTGTLIQAAVSTSSPSYTNGQTNPLSLTPAGALRVDGSEAIQPVSQSGTWTVSLATGSLDVGKVDQGLQGTIAQSWFVELTDGTNVLGTSSHPVRTDPTGTTTQPVSGTFWQATQPVSLTTLPAGTNVIGHVITDTGSTIAVSNFPATQAVTQSTSPWVVSGTITANAGTGTFAISAASLPLPTGASTETTLAAINTKLVTGTVIGDVNAAQKGTWSTGRTWTLASGTDSVSAVQSGTWDIGTLTSITNPVAVTGTFFQATQPVSLASLPPLAAGTNVIGHVITDTGSTTAVTGNVTVIQPTGTNLHAVIDSGSVTVTQATGTNLHVNVDNFPSDSDALAQGSTTSGQLGSLIMAAVTTTAPSYTTAQTSPLSLTTSGLLRVDGSAVTQPISAVSLPLPTGAATVANQTSVIGTVAAGTAATNSLLTGGVFNTVLPTLTTGQQVALQLDSSGRLLVDIGTSATISENVAQFGGNVVVTGTGISGLGIPRVTVSNDSNILATQSGTWNIGTLTTITNPVAVTGTFWQTTQPISASSLPLPTGAATSALQTTGNTSLSSIDSKTPALGQAVMASSVPVVIASNQSAIPVTLTSTTITGTVAVTQSTSPWITTANIGTTNGLALDATLAKLTIAQGTSLGTNTQALVGGSVTTASPTYTTGQISPLSLDTTGALRVNVTAGATSGTVSQGSTTSGQSGNLIQGAVTTAAPTYTTAQTNPLSLMTTGALRIDNTSWLGSTAPTVGSKTSANSIPVVIASDQGAIAVTAAQATASNLNAQVVGNVASAATDSGNPVKIGGVYNTTPPTLTNGQRGDLQLDSIGRVAVVPSLQPDRSGSGTMGALNATVAASTQGCSTIAWQITGTWVGTISFESSVDGTNWSTLDAISDNTDMRVSSTTANAKITINCGGYTQVRMNMTAYTSGTATAAYNAGAGTSFIEVFNDPAQPLYTSPSDGSKATYSAAFSNLTMAATPTDVFTITGSATKTIRVTRVYLTGTQTTGNTADVLLIKRSTADTGGTSTTATIVPYDSNNAAGTAVIRGYTANPTLGTAVGTLASYSMFIPAPAPANGNSPFITPDLFAAIRPAQAIVLRGTSQVLAVNFNSVTVTGNSMDVIIEWTEE